MMCPNLDCKEGKIFPLILISRHNYPGDSRIGRWSLGGDGWQKFGTKVPVSNPIRTCYSYIFQIGEASEYSFPLEQTLKFYPPFAGSMRLPHRTLKGAGQASTVQATSSGSRNTCTCARCKCDISATVSKSRLHIPPAKPDNNLDYSKDGNDHQEQGPFRSKLLFNRHGKACQ